MVPVYFGGDGAKYRITVYPVNNTYASGIETYVFNAGYSEHALGRCSIRFASDIVMAVDAVEIWCQPMTDYPAQIEALRSETLQDIHIKGNTISGAIDVSEPKLLAMSIPYSRGWQVYVDGAKADLLKTNLMYCGVELAPGKHTILMKYESQGVRRGLLISGLSTAVFVLCIIAGRIRSRKTNIQSGVAAK